jgi:hypothetical protein
MMGHSTLLCCVLHLHMLPICMLPSARLLAGCTARSAWQQVVGKRRLPVLTAWSMQQVWLQAAACLGLPLSSPKWRWGQVRTCSCHCIGQVHMVQGGCALPGAVLLLLLLLLLHCIGGHGRPHMADVAWGFWSTVWDTWSSCQAGMGGLTSA